MSDDLRPLHVGPSLIFRSGALTAADYDEAIAMLADAKGQIEPDGRACAVCHDTGHQAQDCHHNPLVRARQACHDDVHWECFHCGMEFTDEQFELAEEHFGKTPDDVAECLRATPPDRSTEDRLREALDEGLHVVMERGALTLCVLDDGSVGVFSCNTIPGQLLSRDDTVIDALLALHTEGGESDG